MIPATVGELIEETRRFLQGTTRGSMNTLATTVNSSTTAIVAVSDLANAITKGAFITIDDEIMYVADTDEATKTSTVIRELLGTTAAAHTAGATIYVGTRFPTPLIRDALAAEIASWPKTVYATDAVTLSVASNTLGVNLLGVPAEFYEVLNVLRKPVTGAQAYSPFSTSWARLGYRVEKNMDTAEFASGAALFLEESHAGGFTVRVVYSRPFVLDEFDTDATELVDDVLLSQSMIDIPPYGAAWRLLSGREVLRTALEAQGESRNAQETPSGATIRAASAFEAFRDKRLSEEAEKLMNAHGWRMT
jgi:hypothetical protein